MWWGAAWRLDVDSILTWIGCVSWQLSLQAGSHTLRRVCGRRINESAKERKKSFRRGELAKMSISSPNMTANYTCTGAPATSFPGPFPWLPHPQAREKALGTRLGPLTCNIIVYTTPDSLNFSAMDRGLRPKKVGNKIKACQRCQTCKCLFTVKHGTGRSGRASMELTRGLDHSLLSWLIM